MDDPMRQGFVSLSAICTFPRIAALTTDVAVLAEALSSSKSLVLSNDKLRVKQRPPTQISSVDLKSSSASSSSASAVRTSSPPSLTDRIVTQIEWYFGDANLPRDAH